MRARSRDFIGGFGGGCVWGRRCDEHACVYEYKWGVVFTRITEEEERYLVQLEDLFSRVKRHKEISTMK